MRDSEALLPWCYVPTGHGCTSAGPLVRTQTTLTYSHARTHARTRAWGLGRLDVRMRVRVCVHVRATDTLI